MRPDHPRVSADGAEWIADVVPQRCPDAVRCADPFHVVGWATEALDAVRREAWNTARRAGHDPQSRAGPWPTRHRVHRTSASTATRPVRAVEEPGEPHRPQRVKLDWIAKTDPRLYRAYLLKEGLRMVFKLPADEAAEALDRWVAWARRCRIEHSSRSQRRIVSQRTQILAAIEHGLSNGLIESVNTKIRLITRIAFGFANPGP